MRRSDVRSAWQGWRPLATDPHAEPGSPVSRDHIVSTHPETGVTFVTGGKWTTYREMAEDVVDRAIARAPALADKWGAVACTSLEHPLLGGKGYTRNTAAKLVQKYSVAEDVARHLAKTCALFDARAREVSGLSRGDAAGLRARASSVSRARRSFSRAQVRRARV